MVNFCKFNHKTINVQALANYAFKTACYAFEHCYKIKPIVLKIMLGN